MEVKLIIRPLFWGIIYLIAAWMQPKTPFRWTALMASQASSVYSSVGALIKLPAVLTRMSIFPKLSMAVWTMACPLAMVPTPS